MRLALGTVQFGLRYGIANVAGQVTRPQARAMLQLAKASGIDTLDTAIAYGDSEACLGEIGTAGFKVVSKLPAVPEGCVDVRVWVHDQLSASLTKLGVTSLYGLLLHRSEQLLSPFGATLYNAMQELNSTGHVKKIGVSIYSPMELDRLASQYRFDLVQAPFNLIDRRLQTSGWLQRLKSDGVEVHTRSAFLQGLLLMEQNQIPEKFMRWRHLWLVWQQWLKQNEITAVQASLAFALSNHEIDRVVVGADSVEQLTHIVNAVGMGCQLEFPALQCEDDFLINPSFWKN
ncbi:MAG: aldo/keto reductase [Pseudohongiella sp.]|nr:aldo/keto reductase [Pseudohongiella sp.]